MRVKISYGIELEDLPEEVQKLYDGVAEWVRILESQSDTTEDLIGEQEFESCLSMLLKMQATMVKMDARITDMSNILKGYVEYKKQNGAEDELPPEGRPVVDPPSSNAVPRPQESDGSDVESGA